VFEALWRSFGGAARAGLVAVVCGTGNNGGDGYVVARCLANRGCRATAYLLGKRDAVRGDAAIHLEAYRGSGGRLVEVAAENRDEAKTAIREAALVVDAVLGTGLVDDVRGAATAAIEWIQEARCPIVSVDIPSGVSSDSGRICGNAVQADLTVTFAYPKRGHYLFPGAAQKGRLEVVEIGIPPAALDRESPDLFCLEEADFAGLLGRRADDHKGTFGHVFVFGGSPGKTGAPGLAAWAALRSGAGLATIAWPEGLASAGRLPLELMTEPLPGADEHGSGWGRRAWEAAESSAARADALVVGPGMGTAPGAAEFLGPLLGAANTTVVLDADALNLVAERPELWRAREGAAILTPHPGEAARLLRSSAGDIQTDRVGAVRKLARQFGCVAILKGAGTLVTQTGSPTFLVPTGNPGMATAGSGDVLSGVLGALLARGLAPLEAGRLGAYVHALAGDVALEERGADGLVASDILDSLPVAFAQLGRLEREWARG
jgi:NAD(P)H-hydrate epimerase